jgi:hypothetical protein
MKAKTQSRLKQLLVVCIIAFFTLGVVACNKQIQINKISIEFNEVPFVKTNIDGVDYLLLIDTGASISLIDSSFVADNKDDPSIKLITLNDTTAAAGAYNTLQLTDLYDVNLFIDSKLNVQQQMSQYNLTILNNKLQSIFKYRIIGVLGCDFLFDNNVIIDIARRQMYIKLPTDTK